MRFSRLLAAAVAVMLPACDSATAPGDGTGSGPGFVTVNDNEFLPATVHPAANGVVTWIWNGGDGHNVIFQDGIGNSTIKVIGVHTRNFMGAAAGTYAYACTEHPGMVGRVVVP
jgi:plastocyanin